MHEFPITMRLDDNQLVGLRKIRGALVATVARQQDIPAEEVGPAVLESKGYDISTDEGFIAMLTAGALVTAIDYFSELPAEMIGATLANGMGALQGVLRQAKDDMKSIN